MLAPGGSPSKALPPICDWHTQGTSHLGGGPEGRDHVGHHRSRLPLAWCFPLDTLQEGLHVLVGCRVVPTPEPRRPVGRGDGAGSAPNDGAALYPLVDDGLLLVVWLEDPNEEAYFVELAATLDDGEAITGAIALNRGYSVAIDDRKARRVLGEKAPGMRLVSTLELVQHWATAVTSQEVILVLRAMQHGAHYIPGQRDPLYDWWRAIMEGSKTDDP